ncbi:hypothetical protein DFH06DRAFT_1133762 [Mycena polygramma]|nr:hypothetical protein DFH06DRAFT_1133762 [Mycena polygramma]
MSAEKLHVCVRGARRRGPKPRACAASRAAPARLKGLKLVAVGGSGGGVGGLDEADVLAVGGSEHRDRLLLLLAIAVGAAARRGRRHQRLVYSHRLQTYAVSLVSVYNFSHCLTNNESSPQIHLRAEFSYDWAIICSITPALATSSQGQKWKIPPLKSHFTPRHSPVTLSPFDLFRPFSTFFGLVQGSHKAISPIHPMGRRENKLESVQRIAGTQ